MRAIIRPGAGNPAAGADAAQNVGEHIEELRDEGHRAFVLVYAFAAAWAGAVAGWLVWRTRKTAANRARAGA